MICKNLQKENVARGHMTSGYKICEIWHIVEDPAFWYTVFISRRDHLLVYGYGYKRIAHTDQQFFKKPTLSRTRLDMVAGTQTI